MRELARRLGMGVSSLYFYFRSKEEIVQFLYRDINDKARTAFAAEPKARTVGADVKRFVEIKLALLAPHRSCLGAILREAVDPDSPLSPFSADSAAVLDDNVTFFTELVRAHKGKNEQDAGRLLWLGHLAVLVFWMHDRSPDFGNTTVVIDALAATTSMGPMVRLLPRANDLMRVFGEMLGDRPAAQGAAVVAEPAAATQPPPRQCDVVVIGGGPIGVLYATLLKRKRPRTRIIVLEKQHEPGHKIGESTLSGFCKALRTVGIRQDVMQRLFYPKNGLGFFHVDESVKELTQASEYILEAFDETFQVERRVLDSLMIANARRLGVQVIQGATVDVKASRWSSEGNVVVYHVGPQEFRLAAPLVADASGPSSVITSATSAIWT